MNWRRIVPQFFTKQWDHWFKKMEGTLVYFAPSYVSKNNNLFSPVIAVVALITAVVLLGIAMGSFFTLFASLLVLYFILTKIFGLHLDAGDVFVV